LAILLVMMIVAKSEALAVDSESELRLRARVRGQLDNTAKSKAECKEDVAVCYKVYMVSDTLRACILNASRTV